MKKDTTRLWLRAGMTANLTPFEIELLKQDPNKWFLKFVEKGKIVFDGESYFPDIDENQPINGSELEFGFDL